MRESSFPAPPRPLGCAVESVSSRATRETARPSGARVAAVLLMAAFLAAARAPEGRTAEFPGGARAGGAVAGAAMAGGAAMASGAAAGGAAGAPRLSDLSETGDALALSLAPDGTIDVRVLRPQSWDLVAFEVRGVRKDARERVRVHGTAPGVTRSFVPEVSAGGGPWLPASNVSRSDSGELRFDVVAPAARYAVRLRQPPPPAPAPGSAPFYSYERFVQYFANIQNDPLANAVQLGVSVQGRPLWRVLIDDPAYPAQGKKTAVMVVRQHGNEYGSSYLLEGTLDLLLGRNGLQPDPDLRRKVRWIIFPLFNPDGAALNQRWNANGVDLNRDWDRTGCNPEQQIETFLQQCELESLVAQFGGVNIGGDHHGWSNAQHGGFRYAKGQPPSNVTIPEYLESRKHTQVITLHDPTQVLWQENGGTVGMVRVEMYKEFGFLIHTSEYNSNLSSAQQFYQKGIGWAEAMLDTLYAPAITDATGRERTFVKLPADSIWVTVDDFDQNDRSGVVESLSVTVAASVTGDQEALVLTETGPDTGVFRNLAPLPFFLAQGAPVPGDGQLEGAAGSAVTAAYVDPDYPPDQSTATVRSVWALPSRATD